MRGSNPRLLAHKTNALTTELMERVRSFHELHLYRESHAVHACKSEARAIRTPNRLIWSQTRYRCAIAPLDELEGRLPSSVQKKRIPQYLRKRERGDSVSERLRSWT